MRPLLIIAASLSLLAVSCQSQPTPNPAADLERQRLQLQQQQADQANIEKCAQQAPIAEQHFVTDSERTGYTETVTGTSNHYSKKWLKCFVEISATHSSQSGYSFSNDVFDAYENASLVSCAASDNLPDQCFGEKDGNSIPCSGPHFLDTKKAFS